MMRWGGGKLRHAHRRREDDLRLVAGAIYFLLTILVVVLVRPLP
jgi:hypothetical protein